MMCFFGAVALLLPLALATPAIAPSQPAPESREAPAPDSDAGDEEPYVRIVPDTTGPPADEAALAMRRSNGSMIVGGWSPEERISLGVGLFTVPKSATSDIDDFNRARTNPMSDPAGRTSRVAAVGISFAF